MPGLMFSIETGVQITRRKFVHILRDPAGSIVWTDRSIGALLQVCADRDITRLEIEVEGRRWVAVLQPLTPQEGTRHDPA